MRVRLSDIAEKAGVTTSTVQRALNDVQGVSEKKRQEIQKIADEMGYKRNILASSLKRGPINIGLILPEATGDNRYYAHYLWEGINDYFIEYGFNSKIIKFPFERSSQKLAETLNHVLDNYSDKLEGIITMGHDDPNVIEALNKINEKQIPVVLVGTDGNEAKRICCVKTHDDMAGRMAADLLLNFSDYKGTSQVIVTGDFTIADQYYNVLGFEKAIYESKAPLEIIKLSNHSDLNMVKESIKNIINSGLDISAIYSSSARNTVPMCHALLETTPQNKIRSIGSDIFPESIDFLERDVLNAIIHKRPSVQAFFAIQILVDYIQKKHCIKSDVSLIESHIVMKSNLECYK